MEDVCIEWSKVCLIMRIPSRSSWHASKRRRARGKKIGNDRQRMYLSTVERWSQQRKRMNSSQWDEDGWSLKETDRAEERLRRRHCSNDSRCGGYGMPATHEWRLKMELRAD